MKESTPVVNGIVNKMESAIQILSAKLGVASEQLWTILVKQAYICAIQNVIAIVIIIILSTSWYLFAKYWIKRMNMEGSDQWDNDGIAGVIIGSGVVAVLAFLIGGIHLSQLIGYLINPEYYALSKILAQFN